MTDILCAIRGGEGSRAVQKAAIQAAVRGDSRLIFLYVVDRRTIGAADEALRPFVRDELYWMGKTLLRVATHRARAAGQTRIDSLIREGEVAEEISRAVIDSGAGQLFINASRLGADAADWSDEFATRVRHATVASVEIVS